MPKCPKCGEELKEVEQDYQNMTDGQQSDYEMGFNRTFECPKCGHRTLCDIEVYEPYIDEEDDIQELVKIIEVNPQSFEDVIENALKSHCYIEATSLIHNVIEAYLRIRLEKHFQLDEHKLKLIGNVRFNYLKNYNLFCYLVGVIKKDEFGKIETFNNQRNTLIHELLKKSVKISQMKQVARDGREMQMRLSPLNHSEKDIQNILKHFDEITEDDG